MPVPVDVVGILAKNVANAPDAALTCKKVKPAAGTTVGTLLAATMVQVPSAGQLPSRMLSIVRETGE